MHLVSNYDGNSVGSSSPQKELFDVVENALEATEDVEGDKITKEDTLVVVPSSIGVEGTLENEEEIVMTPSSETLEENFWPKSLEYPADVTDKQTVLGSLPSDEKIVSEVGTSDSYCPPNIPDTGEIVGSSLMESTPVDTPFSGPIEEGNEPEKVTRPLSPRTTESILSKSPKSAKKLVKDFVASVMKEESKGDELPNMNQVEFINLWRSLYSLFRESADKEQELYQAVARAGTLLLQIGDAANQEDPPRPSSESSFGKSCESDDYRPMRVDFSKKTLDSDQQGLSLVGKQAASDSDASLNDVIIADEPELNVQVQGMTLTEALADAQRSLSSSPGRDESVKSEEYVYVNSGQEYRTSPAVSQNGVAKADYGGMTGSSYKDIASCIGEAPNVMYKGDESETAKSSKSLELTIETSSCKPRTANATTDPGTVSDKWEVGFRQFIACVLSEPALSEFFEKRYDLKAILDKAKHEGLQTCTTSMDDSMLDQTY